MLQHQTTCGKTPPSHHPLSQRWPPRPFLLGGSGPNRKTSARLRVLAEPDVEGTEELLVRLNRAGPRMVQGDDESWTVDTELSGQRVSGPLHLQVSYPSTFSTPSPHDNSSHPEEKNPLINGHSYGQEEEEDRQRPFSIPSTSLHNLDPNNVHRSLEAVDFDGMSSCSSSSSSSHATTSGSSSLLSSPPSASMHPQTVGDHTAPLLPPHAIINGHDPLHENILPSLHSGFKPREEPSVPPSPPPSSERQLVPGIPQPILVISIVSASLTMASCVFNTLLPIYMVTELKMTMRSMGMFEGMLEAFSYIVRMLSGVVSDMMTSRKAAITVGFAMGAAAKFGMSGATEVGSLFACKAIDRLANGVQAAPRDALISDLAPAVSRGSCFGFAQSMRKWGSAVGAVLVFFLMKASNNNYQLIFTMAATVSLASCVAFVMLVPSHVRPQKEREPEEGGVAAVAPAAASCSSPSSEVASSTSAASPIIAEASGIANTKSGAKSGFQMSQLIKDVVGMGPDFYRMLLIICLYGMGHINESLLEARAMEVGFGKAESTLVVATLAFVIFICAYPLGRLEDRYGPRVTFGIGMAALVIADLVLLVSGTHPWAVFASLLFMGIHMGVFQGPILGIVVGLAPSHLRGTAFGIFYTVMAVTALGAQSLLGSVWHAFGATSAFGLSAAMTFATLVALPWLLPENARHPRKEAPPPPPPPPSAPPSPIMAIA